MPLITSTTNLNKLKFGSDNSGDRFASGFSNQPYIRKDIPGVDVDNSNPTPIAQLDSSGQPIYGDLPPSSLDILFRGGLNAPRDAATDVSRLSKMFFDTRSPNGLIFTANQQLLSRTSVMTEASYGAGYGRNKEPDFIKGEGGGALASGIYLPTSTLAQAGVGFTGTHLNLMGLDPSSPMTGVAEGTGLSGLLGIDAVIGLRTYSSEMSRKIQESIADADPKTAGTQIDPTKLQNRLVSIYNERQQIKTEGDTIISYQGGPGSVLGIGSTNIRFAGSNAVGNTRTGLNNNLAIDATSAKGNGYFTGKGQGYNLKYLITVDPNAPKVDEKIVSAYGSTPQSQDSPTSEDDLVQTLTSKLGLSIASKVASATGGNGVNRFADVNGAEVFLMNQMAATYTLDGSFPEGKGNDARAKYTPSSSPYAIVMDKAQLDGAQPEFNDIPGSSIIGPAFNNTIYSGSEIIQNNNSSNILSISPDYKKKNIALRTNFGDPGSNGPKILTSRGAEPTGRLKYGVKASDMIAIDKINAMNMYSGSIASTDERPVNDLCKFRIAAIDNDNPGSALYMHFRAFITSFSDNYASQWDGFKYSGRGEELYHYTGFSRNINLSFDVYAQSKAELIPMYRKLNYLASTMAPDYTSAGFMRGNLVRLTMGGYLYEQPGFISSLTYEVPQEATWEIAINEEGGPDNTVKELPHMIRVTGMAFTPIHEFLPQKINPRFANGVNNQGVAIEERYIALSNGRNTNYVDSYVPQKPSNTDQGTVE